eukprot:CAMPEP_0114150502 /NCGR_PEP_ID=MMETSP0043_2-20121206/22745_1 /TAXON_ID=464988 /ORGANISM="Hemiselmis andersenii, Strain CCMP644" /LENGTH=70 /DNA_ID=CAMNT_0001245253 /DNA_START=323 /DNA_END=532 /DNA_ORIENTATION=+
MAARAASMSALDLPVPLTTCSHWAGVRDESLMRVLPVTANSDVCSLRHSSLVHRCSVPILSPSLLSQPAT